MKWEPAPWQTQFERQQRHHARMHRVQRLFDVAVVVALLALAARFLG
jgi:hypothetical protein